MPQVTIHLYPILTRKEGGGGKYLREIERTTETMQVMKLHGQKLHMENV